MTEGDQLERFCQQFDIERSDPLSMAVALAEKLGEQVNGLAAIVKEQDVKLAEFRGYWATLYLRERCLTAAFLQ